MAAVRRERRSRCAAEQAGARKCGHCPGRCLGETAVMKIALDPAMLNARPVEAGLRSAAEAGYAYVELGNRADFIPAFKAVCASPTDLARIRRDARASGVEIASVAVIQAWSSPDEDVRAQAVAWWRQGIAAAVELGCSRINSELSGDHGRLDEIPGVRFGHHIDALSFEHGQESLDRAEERSAALARAVRVAGQLAVD